MSTKVALLVGLCQVLPAAYNGWNGANGCEGCELDVENVEKILTPFGYTIQMLKTAAATKSAILSHLEKAAQSLQADDMFVFYYAGHGGQQPDTDSDETDNRDETLLAYDGEITDDELNQIWPRFQPGVRIVMLSDSCNSGTNYRDVRDVFTPTPMQALPQGTRAVMQAQLIHFGGCRDGFTSAGYEAGGAFTMALANVWQGGNFVGNYQDLHKAVAAKIPPNQQQPQYNEYGSVTEAFRNERPFAGPAQPTTGLPRPVPTESPLSQENQRLLIEAYLKLLETLNVETPLRARSSEHCHLVYVHGIRTHVTGYSGGWWGALKPYTTLFGACQLDDTRHEVLWSNLVNSRSAHATRAADEAAIAALQERIMDVLEDRHRQQAAPSGRSAAARVEASRGLEGSRDRGFSLDDFLVYMVNKEIRQQIIDRFTRVVRPLLGAGAELNIIAHSWGSVVAYEGLRELETEENLTGHVANFFTVGSALSLPPVRSSLRAANRDGRRPRLVNRWINVDAQGDLVGGALADRFAVDVEKLEIEPTGCERNLGGLGWYNLGCAHGSYFRPENRLVNQQIFAQYINT
jgi:hypothetical protein